MARKPTFVLPEGGVYDLTLSLQGQTTHLTIEAVKIGRNQVTLALSGTYDLHDVPIEFKGDTDAR